MENSLNRKQSILKNKFFTNESKTKRLMLTKGIPLKAKVMLGPMEKYTLYSNA
jgi:hypothetical protein